MTKAVLCHHTPSFACSGWAVTLQHTYLKKWPLNHNGTTLLFSDGRVGFYQWHCHIGQRKNILLFLTHVLFFFHFFTYFFFFLSWWHIILYNKLLEKRQTSLDKTVYIQGHLKSDWGPLAIRMQTRSAASALFVLETTAWNLFYFTNRQG